MPQSLNPRAPIQSPPVHLRGHLTSTGTCEAPSECGQKTKRDAKLLRDQAILNHLPVVRAIALRVHAKLPVQVELDDLIHAGILGLIDAVGKYDFEKKVDFRSYAQHRIKGAILDSLRQLDWASRDVRRRHKQVEAVKTELSAQFKRAPTEAEIAEKMGVTIDRWRQMAVALPTVGLVSASSRRTEGENAAVPEFPATQEFHPDCMCAKEELRKVLLDAIKSLPERFQQVVVLYYTKDMKMHEIGIALQVNESRVSQMHKRALEKLAIALKAAGINSCSAFLA